MLTIFYSPHASSIDNEAGRASGHADVPLSTSGRQQAQKLGQHYAAIPLDAVFCSDLQRAAITGKIAFANRALPLLLDARLRECDYGKLTQSAPSRIEEEFAQRITEPFPGGESMLMVAERVGAFLRDVLREYDGKTIAVIGHRATKYGLEYWCGKAASLEAIVQAVWEWRDVPIWRYELQAHDCERRGV